VIRSRPVRSCLALSFCLVALNGCVVAAVGGAVGGGYALSRTGEPGPSAAEAAAGTDDAGIKDRIEARWLNADAALADGIEITVFRGRVLLTGTVPSQALHDTAVAQAWQVDGIEQVIDEIRIGEGEHFGSAAGDTWIETKLQATLALDGDVGSADYALRTVNGVVYVLGEARDQAELDRVLNHARNQADVRRVVSYVRVRSDAGAAPPAEAVTAPAPLPAPDLAPPPEPGPAIGRPVTITPLPPSG
jgi:osmotically-inducible protein OsmY